MPWIVAVVAEQFEALVRRIFLRRRWVFSSVWFALLLQCHLRQCWSSASYRKRPPAIFPIIARTCLNTIQRRLQEKHKVKASTRFFHLLGKFAHCAKWFVQKICCSNLRQVLFVPWTMALTEVVSGQWTSFGRTIWKEEKDENSLKGKEEGKRRN